MGSFDDDDGVEKRVAEANQRFHDECITPGQVLQEEVATCFVILNSWIRYCAETGAMYVFRGGRWQRDRTQRVKDALRNFCQGYFTPGTGKPKDRENLARRRTIEDIYALVCMDQRIAVTREQLDADPYLLGTPAGTVDLRTGELRESDPDDLITRATAVVPGGDCSRFRGFLGEITEQRVELMDYLQRLFGLALIGSVLEHVLAFFYGGGANGKTTLLDVILSTLGEYAHIAQAETFLQAYGERHPTDVAKFAGARLVCAEEIGEGRGWNVPLIKQATGGAPMTARFMRQDSFTFTPSHTLILAGNHKPSLRTVDEAMRRRLHLVPFLYTVPLEDRDVGLPATLEAERSGILAWMIEGCLAYQREGLNPPAIVLEKTGEYFEAQDELKAWQEDCCTVGAAEWDQPTRLFASWRRWCEAQEYNAGTMKTFSDRLESVGHRRGKTGPRGRHWVGLSVATQPNVDDSQ